MKVLLWIFSCVFILVFLIIIILQVPVTQRYIASEIVSYVSGKTRTKVALRGINIGFPKTLVLKDLFLEDLKKDTLLYAKAIRVNVNLLALFKKKIELSSLELEKITAHVNRRLPDSAFNFDFFVRAFAGPDMVKAAPETKETSKDTSGGMAFSILEVRLKDIYMTYNDEVSGMDVNTRLGLFHTELDEFDLEKMRFKIDEIRLENTYAYYFKNKISPAEAPDTSSKQPDIDLGKLLLKNIAVNYQDKTLGQKLDLSLGYSTLEADKIDLPAEKINLDRFLLYNTSLSYTQSRVAAKDTVKKVAEKAAGPGKGEKAKWQVNLADLDLRNNNITYNDNTQPEKKEGFDFSHLNASDFYVNVHNISYNPNRSSANVQNISFREKRGFELKKFAAKIVFDTVHTALSNLDIQTANSRIGNFVSIGYKNLDSLTENMGDMKVRLDLQKTHISPADLVFFQPELKKQPVIRKNLYNPITVNAEIHGKVKDLAIRKFVITAGKQTAVRVTGSIKGLPEAEKALFDIVLEEVKTGREDAHSFIPAAMLSGFNVPSSVVLKGNFKGKLKEFETKAFLETTNGSARTGFIMREGRNGREFYKGALDVNNLDLGFILNQRQNLGPVTLSAKLDGSGLSPKEIKTQIRLDVKKAVLMGYGYQNFMLNGNYSDERFVGKAVMNDPNLAFNFNGEVNLKDKLQKFDFDFNLLGSDLKALKLSKDDIRVSGKVNTDITGNDVRTINGNLGIRKVLIIKNGKQYPIDSLVFASVNGGGNSSLKLQSHILTADFRGNISVADLPDIISEHLDIYFNRNKQAAKKRLKPQNFDFNLKILEPSVLTEVLVPKLDKLEKSEISGHYDSEKKNLSVLANIPVIDYDSTRVDSLQLSIASNPDSLEYTLKLKKISNPAVIIDKTLLSGNIHRDSIVTRLLITNPDTLKKLFVAGLITSKNQQYKFHLDTTGLIFNNTKWSVPENNYFSFGKYIYANNLRFTNNQQEIGIESKGEKNKNAPMLLTFKDFDLKTLSAVVQKEQPLLGGLLNGTVKINNLSDQFSFTSDLLIKNLAYLTDTLGDFALKASNKKAGRYDLNMQLLSNKNKMNIDGFYATNARNNNLNFNVNLAKLDVSTFKTILAEQAQALGGIVTGSIKITGTTDKPLLNGQLSFRGLTARPVASNVPLHLDNQAIVFDKAGIKFNNFTIKDSLNNNFIINGNIATVDYRNYKLDLNLNTDNFLALNSTAQNNSVFFGELWLSSKIRINGDQNQPVINAQLKLNKGTDVTFVNTESQASVESSNGIVVFIDADQHLHPIMKEGTLIDTTKQKQNITNLDLTADIVITDESLIRVAVDPSAGDSLKIRANSNLSFALDPSGKTSLSGTMEVAEGNYQLTLSDIVKRKFELAQGSKIVWGGDPTAAQLDLRAVYMTKTSPLPLVGDQSTGTGQSSYSKKLPFLVYLNIKGEMLKPEISFELQLPDDYKGELGGSVYAKVMQINENKSELNQQVFGLLVLNKFITGNPLESQGGGLASTARSSVSDVLADQLNALSGRYIKGVDLNVGLESTGAGAGGGETQLQLGLSKQLLDDRLKVQVGSNVEVEGANARKENNLNNLAGDVSLEYTLTEDGQYVLKAARKSQYQAIEGELIKTSASIIFNKDYNKLKELFSKTEKEKTEDQSKENVRK